VNNPQAVIAVMIGVMVILWMTISAFIPENLSWLKSPFHANMIIVIGTLSIFMSGLLIRKMLPGGTKE
jgi:SSS family solute:Na+ symporter